MRHIPGHCTTTNVTVGHEYLVYLARNQGGGYTPRYVQDPVDEEYLEEIIDCDTRISYPTGLSEKTTNYKCPDPLPKAECETKVDATDNVPADSENPVLLTTIISSSGLTEKTTNNKCPNPLSKDECEPSVIGTDNVPADSENPEKVTPEKSVVAEPSKEDNGNNASTTLTWHIITLLLVSSIFLL